MPPPSVSVCTRSKVKECKNKTILGEKGLLSQNPGNSGSLLYHIFIIWPSWFAWSYWHRQKKFSYLIWHQTYFNQSWKTLQNIPDSNVLHHICLGFNYQTFSNFYITTSQSALHQWYARSNTRFRYWFQLISRVYFGFAMGFS